MGRRRPAFTLIELLVVMAIILLLAALGAAAASQVVGSQQQSNSRLTVQKVEGALQENWRAVIATARGEADNDKTLSAPAKSMAMGGTGTEARRRASVIHIYLRLRQEFPMSFEEITTTPAGALPPLDVYAKALTNPARPPNAGWSAATGGAPRSTGACLYLILKQGRRGVTFDPDASLSSRELVDPFGDGIKEIVDGRGSPVAFFRWPHANIDLNPSGPIPGQGNPLDPDRLLESPAWMMSNPTGKAQFEALFHPVERNASFKNLSPVVVSSGKDRLFGLGFSSPGSPYSGMPVAGPQSSDNLYGAATLR